MELKCTTRNAPIIAAPKNTFWSWKQVLNNEKKPSFLTKIRLLTKSWNTVIAPKNYAGELFTNGCPLYQYKKIGNNCYYLEPRPSPGFPGN